MGELPNNLRYIRKNHSDRSLRSGEEIARLMNLSKQYYYDLETGRNGARLNIDHINQLTKIFNVTSDDILTNQQVVNETTDNKKIPKDLKKILEEKTLMFDGEIMSEDEKLLIDQMLTKMYYKSKELNKRK